MTHWVLFALALWMAWKCEPSVAVLLMVAVGCGLTYTRLTRVLWEEKRVEE